MTEVKARSLKAAEVSLGAAAKLDFTKELKLSEWGGRGWVLVHDGKHIIAHHGPDAVTGTGNPAYKMLVGDEREIIDEIKRLGLITGDDNR